MASNTTYVTPRTYPSSREEAPVKRLRLLAAAVGAVALLGPSVAQAAGPYPPPSKGTGRVEPSRIKVGECAVFSGDGFAPVTSVAVSDNGSARGTATTDVAGEFSKRLCYGSDARRGRHDLAGSGTGSDGSPLTVYAVLIVEGINQSASNPGTQPGGAAASSGDTTGGSVIVPVAGGTTGGVEAPVAEGGSTGSTVPAGTENSGTRLLLIGLAALGFAFLASLLLLLIARRRRRKDGEEEYGSTPLPA